LKVGNTPELTSTKVKSVSSTTKNLAIGCLTTNFRKFASSFGYLIPWFYLRQHETIAGMAKPSPSHAGDKVLKNLGDAVRQLRTARGLSQEALAVDADLDRSYVGGIERGEHNLTVMNLKKISDALGVKMATLLVAADL
jgi:DNA-binding XRE family transcriptional regulator